MQQLLERIAPGVTLQTTAAPTPSANNTVAAFSPVVVNWDVFFGTDSDSTTPNPASGSTPAPAPNLQEVSMFNACQRGDLAEMQRLHAQEGVPLTTIHPYNHATLVHVAIYPGLRPSGNGWDTVSHSTIVEWLLSEISCNNASLVTIFEAKITDPAPGQTTANFPQYHPTTMSQYAGCINQDIKTLSDRMFAVVAGSPNGLAEARGQTSSPVYSTNLGYAQATYNKFLATKQSIDTYHAQYLAAKTALASGAKANHM